MTHWLLVMDKIIFCLKRQSASCAGIKDINHFIWKMGPNSFFRWDYWPFIIKPRMADVRALVKLVDDFNSPRSLKSYLVLFYNWHKWYKSASCISWQFGIAPDALKGNIQEILFSIRIIILVNLLSIEAKFVQ